MRKLFKSLALVAVAAMTLSACQKEVEPQQKNEEGLYEYSFTILEDGTRAVIGDNNIEWVEGDQVGIIVESFAGPADVNVNTNPKTVAITSTDPILAGTTAYAYFPYNEANDTPDRVIVTIPSLQNGSAESVMPMAGIPFEVQDAVAANGQSNGAIKFLNLGSLVGFKIFSSDEKFQGETVLSVSFEANKPIAGSGYIDLTSINIDDINGNDYGALDIVFDEEEFNTVTVNQSVEVRSDEKALTPIKMVLVPGEYYGTITVTTDAAVYTKALGENGNSKEFERSGSRNFRLDLADAERDPEWVEGYKLISSTNDVTSGRYIVAAKVDGDYFAMSNTFAQKIGGVEVIPANGVIPTVNGEDYVVTIVKDGDNYTISSDTQTLGYSSSTNFNLSGGSTTWLLSSGENGTFRFTNSGNNGRVIAYREDTQVFGPYASSNVTSTSTQYYDVELFKFNGSYVIKTNPTTTVAPDSPISLTVDETQQLTVDTDSDGDISYESSNSEVASVSEGGLITANAEGTATITISTSETDTFNAGTTNIVVTVTAGASTIADVISGGAGTYEVPDVIVYAVKGNALIIGDDTAKMYAYKSNHGLTVGDVRTVSGNTKIYNEVYEFDAPNFTGNGTAEVNHGTAAEFDSVVEDLQEAYSDPYTAVYVHAVGSQSGRSITTSGNNILYLSAENASTDGKNVEVSGYVYAYNTSHSNFNFLATSIEEYVDPDAAVLEVTANSLDWLYNETDSKTVMITVNANGSVSKTESNMSWASVSLDNNILTVTPLGENGNSTQDNQGTITLTHSVDPTLVEVITCTQSKKVDLVTAVATFTGAASGGMTGSQAEQTGVRRNVTAVVSNGVADEANNHIRVYKNATLTLSVPEGAVITGINFTGLSSYPVSGFANMSGFSTSGNDGSWTGSASSVTFTASGAQVRLSAISVTYQIASASLINYTPTIFASDMTLSVGDNSSIGATSESEGVISYSILSGDSYITLNESTGAITAEAKGTAVVRISVAASGDFDAGHKDINIEVLEPIIGSDSETITFSSLYNSNTTLDGVEIKGDDFSVMFSKGTGSTAPQYYTNGTAVRWYAKGTLTVSSERTIVGVTFTFGASDGSNEITADSGSISGGNWSGSATSVVFTQGGTGGNRRIAAITVTYE